MSKGILIASKFHRPQAPVTLPNDDGTVQEYFFLPVDPKNPDSEHVALVTDKAHQQRLLSIGEGYCMANANDDFKAADMAASTVKRPTPAEKTPAHTTGTNVEADDGEDKPGGVESQSAEDLLDCSLSEFKNAVKNVDTNTLDAALAIEEDKGRHTRPTFVKTLKAQLKKS